MPAYRSRVQRYLSRNADNALRSPPHILQQPHEDASHWFRRLTADEDVYPSVLCTLETHEGGNLTNFAIISSYTNQIRDMVQETNRHIEAAISGIRNINNALSTIDVINAESAIKSGILPVLSHYRFDSGITGDGSAQAPYDLQTSSSTLTHPNSPITAHSSTLRVPTIPRTNSPEPLPIPPISTQRGIPSTRPVQRRRVSFVDERTLHRSPTPVRGPFPNDPNDIIVPRSPPSRRSSSSSTSSTRSQRRRSRFSDAGQCWRCGEKDHQHLFCPQYTCRHCFKSAPGHKAERCQRIIPFTCPMCFRDSSGPHSSDCNLTYPLEQIGDVFDTEAATEA